MNSPSLIVSIDSYGGRLGPGAVYARIAREIMGEERVRPVELRVLEVAGLESLLDAVKATSSVVLMMGAGIPRIVPFLEAFNRAGIVNDLTQTDRDKVHRWPSCVKPEFIGRQVEVCTLDVCNSAFLERFTDTVSGKFFAKTLIKKSPGHGTLINRGDIISAREKGLPVADFFSERSFVPIDESETLILSQPLEIAEDEKGKIEYRSWIINHELSCVSRYWKENTPIEEADSDILDFIYRFMTEHRDILPKHYVLDFARTKSGQIGVIELNFLSESGIAGDESVREAVLRHIFNSLKTTAL